MSIFHRQIQPYLLALLGLITLLATTSAAPQRVSALPAVAGQPVARTQTGQIPARQDIPAAAWSRRMDFSLEAVGHPYEDSTKIDDGPWGGLPIGGLGAGAIGRTYRGDFARWHLDLGTHRFESLPANQFSVFVAQGGQAQAHVLSPLRPAMLPEWNWDMPPGAGTYYALFPRAWYVYQWAALPVHLTQKQFSPVLPGNYQASSYPVGIFEWTVDNPTAAPLTLGLMFTWQNMVGWGWNKDLEGGNINYAFQQDGFSGVMLTRPGEPATEEEWDGSFALVAPQQPGLAITYRSRFPVSGGGETWADFAGDGRLSNLDDPTPAQPGEQIAAALAVTVDLQPGETRVIPFALAWDFPITQFDGGAKWYKRYTRFYGTSGRTAGRIGGDALAAYPDWESAVDVWQQPILADPARPEWYKTALFNELYYLVDGGTVWENGPVGGGPPADNLGGFAYLESADAGFYNPAESHFYASFALAGLWPELQKRLMRDVAAAVPAGDPADTRPLLGGAVAPRKMPGAVPYDLGSPREAPWQRPNAFNRSDPNSWKELASQFVLQLWRDYLFTGDLGLVRELWPAAVQAIDYVHQFDRDGDGLPEHDGSPDQGYADWTMSGPAAYSGSLWLAALEAAINMAEQVGDAGRVAQYRAWLDSGKGAFEAKLWAGQYYRLDAGGSPHSDSIMANQLAGQWYADATGLAPIVPPEHAVAALRTIFDYNVRRFAGGQMGAVNGMRPDGNVDTSGSTAQEVWPGATYALAAALYQRGLTQEAWETAWGVYNVTYNQGFWFRTPAAYRSDGSFRASMAARSLAIWAMEQALQRRASAPLPAGAEPVQLTTADGVALAAHYYPPNQPAGPGVLLLHMRGGRKENWASWAQLLQKQGYAVLAVDFRGHGQSKGVVNWFGADQDVAAAYEYLAGRSEVEQSRIALIGASIGTQEAITFAAAHPAGVQGVAMLSTFRSGDIEQGLQAYPGPILLLATQGDRAATQVSWQLAKLVPRAELYILKNSDRHGTQMLGSDLEIEPILLDWLARVVPAG